jgi:hypothetical protein
VGLWEQAARRRSVGGSTAAAQQADTEQGRRRAIEQGGRHDARLGGGQRLFGHSTAEKNQP